MIVCQRSQRYRVVAEFVPRCLPFSQQPNDGTLRPLHVVVIQTSPIGRWKAMLTLWTWRARWKNPRWRFRLERFPILDGSRHSPFWRDCRRVRRGLIRVVPLTATRTGYGKRVRLTGV